MSNFFNPLNLTKELYWFMLSVMLISLAYPSPPITSVAYISLVFFSLVHGVLSGVHNQLWKDKMLFLVLLFILSVSITHVYMEGSFYSNRLWKLHSFGLVFLAIYLGPKISIYTLARLKLYFIVSLIACSFIGLIKVAIMYQFRLVNSVTYINYAVQLGVLSTYFALLVCVGIIFLLPSFFRPVSKRETYLSTAAFLYLLVILSVLSVRISWLALLVSVGWSIVYYRLPFKKIALLALMLFLASGLTYFTAKQNVLDRISKTTEIRGDVQLSDAQNRLELWSCALHEFTTKASFFWGIGIQQYQDYLNDCYYKNRLYHAHEQSYNTHNQYLQTLLNTGFLGLFVFLAILFYALYVAIKEKQLQFTLILLTFAVFFITESFFEKTLGILTYASFLGVYWNLLRNDKHTT